MFPEFPHTFTPKKCKNVTTNLICKKTPCVQLTILPNLKKIHHPEWCGWLHFASLKVCNGQNLPHGRPNFKISNLGFLIKLLLSLF